MNPSEIYQFLTQLVRDGAEVIGAAIIAVGVGLFGGWKFASWFRQRETEANEKEIKELTAKLLQKTEEVDRLKTELGGLKDKVAVYEQTIFTEVEKRVQERLAPLTAERDALKKDTARLNGLVTRYRNERNLANQQAERLQGEFKAANELVAKLEQDIKSWQERMAAKDAELHQATARFRSAAAGLEKVRDQVRSLTREVETQRQIADVAQKKFEDTEAKLIETQQTLGKTRQELSDACQERDEQRERADALEKQIQSIRAQGGKIWERPVSPEVPRFVPLGQERRSRVISLLNLKGGVGKTTLTLNLAATLADQDKKVLMIDCDHQRSLSALCLPQKRQVALHDSQRTLQHFLLSPDRSAKAFLNCVHDLPNMPFCSVVVNTASHQDDEGLANVEDSLMLDWLASPKYDVRHTLRGVLHSKEVSDNFNYVFLDCPPRLSTATINALAASDFVLIPIGLDVLSAVNPLPLLLRELRSLNRKAVFPHFKILGVVANRVHYYGGNIVGNQWPVWESLPGALTAYWGQPVHRFKTMISQDKAFAKEAKIILKETDKAVVVWKDPDVKTLFKNLTTEIEERIASETPHSQPVHA